MMTRSLPTSGGLCCRCSKGSCGRRSVYEAYSSGRPGSGGGGSHLVPCSRPTGTAPGRATPPSSTTAQDAISTVTGVAESRRIHNSPWRGAPGGGRGLTDPGCAESSQLEHCSPTAYKGCGGLGGSSLECRHPWSLASECHPAGLSSRGPESQAPCAKDHTGDDQRKGRGVGTELVQGACAKSGPAPTPRAG